MKVKEKRTIIFWMSVAAMVIMLITADYQVKSQKEKVPCWTTKPVAAKATNGLTPAVVKRVVDGDTIVVNIAGKEEKVRLIGIDTPESVHPDSKKNSVKGLEASEYTKSVLKKDGVVYLEKDVSERDSYGRLLRYVWLTENKEDMKTDCLNAILVYRKFAKVKKFEPDVKYYKKLKKYEKSSLTID